MPQLTERERIEILMMIGFGDRTRSHAEVCRLFNNLHPNHNPISRSTVTKTLTRYNLNGNVRNSFKSGRPKTATDETTTLNVALELEETPQTSTTSLALNNDISRRSIGRILRKEKYYPYKVRLVQELSEDDYDRRVEFCEQLLEICNNDPNFASNIVFSDEASFCLNGTVNRHNCRYWSIRNPHWIQEAHTQHHQKINVWIGIFRNRIIGPFFIDGTLTGQKYLELLRRQIVPAIEQNREVPLNVWFQQDGAPPHYERNVCNFLNEIFPYRWIGRRGFIEWPARSPDLNPLDFFLWGHLKSVVYTHRPNNLEDLRQKIIDEVAKIHERTLVNVTQEFVHRLAHCLAVDGSHFEHLLN